MKKQILSKLAKIKRVAEITNMEGRLTLKFTGCTMEEWDNAVKSITEYPRYKHFVDVSDRLMVTLLFEV